MKGFTLAIFLLSSMGCGHEPPTDRTATTEERDASPDARVAYGLSGKSGGLDEDYDKHLSRLAPGIAYIDQYIDQHDKLPTQREFQTWAEKSGAHMLIIWDRNHEYAAKHGAKTETDYMLGTWMSEWYFYYKSWDGNYVYAQDERL